MKKIKFLFLLLILSSCNQYLGKIEDDYNPSKETTKHFSGTQIFTNNIEVNLGDIIYPKFGNSALSVNNFEIIKIFNTDRRSVVGFFKDKIFLSKDKKIYVIDESDYKNKYEYKLDLNKDEQVLYFFEYKSAIYAITNSSRVYTLDSQKASMVADYNVYTNINPIVLEDKIIILSVFGDIYQIDLNNETSLKIKNFNAKLGVTIRSNIFEDQENLYYLFNSNTLITLDKDTNKFYDNYILEDLNILSSLESFNDLVDTPFSFNDYLYFLDHSGKIAVYNQLSSEILWEIDINEAILDYLFSNNGYLIILTFKRIIILSDKGKIIKSFMHNKETPISIFNIQEFINLISDEGITSFNLKNNSENSFIKNKFSSNLDIFYQDQNIYLKDAKSFFKLSE